MRPAVEWVKSHIPYQHGRLVLITGADSGIGFHTARVLASRGAHIVLACRDPERGRDAQRRITGAVRNGGADVLHLDTGDLTGVRRAAEEIRQRYDYLDVVINSAGAMTATPRRTPDGFERQFAINHLGHFGLTGLLLPTLLAGERPRVVTVSDAAHRHAAIRFDDPNWERHDDAQAAYGQSRLANMLFTFELQRRCARADLPLSALSADPGTNAALLSPQRAVFACLPVVAAAALPEAQGAEHWSPSGRWRPRGLPVRTVPGDNATDIAAARRLWTLSEELTGVTFEIPERDVA